jgi:hypothetical protein
MALYELLGTVGETSAYPASARDTARCRDWVEAYSAYHDRDRVRARDALRAFLAAYGDDTACQTLLARCESFLATSPAAAWDAPLVFADK